MSKATRNALIAAGIFGCAAAIALVVYVGSDGEVEPAAQAHPGQERSDSPFQGLVDAWRGGPASAPRHETLAPAASAEGADSKANMDAARDMRMKALADPAGLRVLVQRYATERDPAEKQRIKVVLSTINKPEVVDLVKELLSSGDAGRRRDGLELAQRLSSGSADMRKTILLMLASEQSPEVLVQAMLALPPAAVEPYEQQQIVARLVELSQSGNVEVRRQSIQSLGFWDSKGDTRDRLKLAANDQAPEVREAAVQALNSINSRLKGSGTSH